MMGSNASGQLGVKVQKSPGITDSQSIESHSTLNEESARSLQNAQNIINQNNYFEPIPLELPDPTGCKIVKIACGEQHTLALNKRGLVYAWGEARYGALGLDFNLLAQKHSTALRTKKNMQNKFEMSGMGM